MKTGPSELPRSEELHNEDSSGLDQLPQVLNLTSPLSGSGSGLVGRLQRYILDDCFHKLATRLRSTKPETQALLSQARFSCCCRWARYRLPLVGTMTAPT